VIYNIGDFLICDLLVFPPDGSGPTNFYSDWQQVERWFRDRPRGALELAMKFRAELGRLPKEQLESLAKADRARSRPQLNESTTGVPIAVDIELLRP
jgi:hypothetical protein